MGFTVYKITNTVGNKIYIGSTTTSVEKRWVVHLSSSKNKNHEHYPLYIDMRKLGVDKFIIEIIEECKNKSEMLKRELFWIQQLNSGTPNGYNSNYGQTGFPKEIKQCIIDGINTAMDGRKRRWLSDKTGLRCPVISDLLNGYKQFKQEDLDKINSVLHTNFKL